MLRSFEQLCHATPENLTISVDAGQATLAHSGDYAKPWHWHDCVMFILPSHGTLELRHEDCREGTWLSHDRFAVVPCNRAHQTQAGIGANSHVALYVTADVLQRLDREIGSLSEFHRRIRCPVLVRRSSTIRALQELSLGGDDSFEGVERVDKAARKLQADRELRFDDENDGDDATEVSPAIELARRSESLTSDLVRQHGMRPALYVDIDTDIYVSTYQALDWLCANKLLVPGSIIGYDDFKWGLNLSKKGAKTKGAAQVVDGEARAHDEVLVKKYGLKMDKLGNGLKADSFAVIVRAVPW